MMEWSTFCAVNVGLGEHERYLVQCQAGSSHSINPPVVPTSALLEFATEECGFRSAFQSTRDPISQRLPDPIKWSSIVKPLDQLIFVQSLRNTVPHSILFRYLSNAAPLDSAPYQWEETCTTIDVDDSIPFAVYGELLKEHLEPLDIAGWEYSSLGSQYCWGDTVITKLMSFWRPTEPTLIPYGILTYMTRRPGMNSVVSRFLSGFRSGMCDYVWPCIRPTLDSYHKVACVPHMDFNRCLWALAFWTTGPHKDGREFSFTTDHSLANTCYTDALEAISLRKSFFSTMAIIKMGIPNGVHTAVYRPDADYDLTALLRLGIFPPDMDHSIIKTMSFKLEQMMAAKLHVLSEFLEQCSSDKVPCRAAETVKKLTIDGRDPMECERYWRTLGSGSVPVHSVAQLRFAASVHAVFAKAKPRRELVDAIVCSELLDGYAGVEIITSSGNIRGHPWLTDPIARRTLTEVFTSYEVTLSADPKTPKDLLDRVRAILNGFSTMHPDPDPQPDAATVDADDPKAREKTPENVPSEGGIAPNFDSPEDAV
ncbi:hypothetical protein DFH06DRAFT_401113 [Mycena polygramma]|nr:hypothetical protein DFH06DRAFT_401113 [Mycena polygramma]